MIKESIKDLGTLITPWYVFLVAIGSMTIRDIIHVANNETTLITPIGYCIFTFIFLFVIHAYKTSDTMRKETNEMQAQIISNLIEEVNRLDSQQKEPTVDSSR